jgi:hypothetical protein
MGLGGARWTHLVEVDFAASFCGLEGGFGAGEAAADDPDAPGCHASPSSLDFVKVFQRKELSLDLTRKLLIPEAG